METGIRHSGEKELQSGAGKVVGSVRWSFEPLRCDFILVASLPSMGK